MSKSLALVDDQGEETRYRYLETVRQYALEKLLASGEAGETRARHLAYFTAQAARAWPESYEASPQRPYWLAWVVRELDNLRLAQDWALEHDLPAAIRLVSDLCFFLFQTGQTTDNLRFLRQARAEYARKHSFSEASDARHHPATAGNDRATVGFARATVGRDRERGLPELMALSWFAEGNYLHGMGEYGAGMDALINRVRLARQAGLEQLLALALALKSVFPRVGLDG